MSGERVFNVAFRREVSLRRMSCVQLSGISTAAMWKVRGLYTEHTLY